MRYQLTIDEAEKLSDEAVASYLRAAADHVEQHGRQVTLVTSSVGLTVHYYSHDILGPDYLFRLPGRGQGG